MDEGAGQGISEGDARRIARLLLHEMQAPPPDGPSDELLALRHQLSDEDEDRIEDELVKMGAVDREVTTRVHRDADRAASAEPAG